MTVFYFVKLTNCSHLYFKNPLTNHLFCDIIYLKMMGTHIPRKETRNMPTATKNRSLSYPHLSPTKTQQSFFRAADAVSSLSDHSFAKLGCVLVDKHRIISSGHNSSTRCSPLQKQIDVARFGDPDKHKGPVHAETSCLLPLIRQGYDMTRSDLYIVRRHKNGSLALSRPCPGCMSLLRANGVRRVFFSVEGGYAMERI